MKYLGFLISGDLVVRGQDENFPLLQSPVMPRRGSPDYGRWKTFLFFCQVHSYI
jgi:hypothetical protein